VESVSPANGISVRSSFAKARKHSPADGGRRGAPDHSWWQEICNPPIKLRQMAMVAAPKTAPNTRGVALGPPTSAVKRGSSPGLSRGHPGIRVPVQIRPDVGAALAASPADKPRGWVRPQNRMKVPISRPTAKDQSPKVQAETTRTRSRCCSSYSFSVIAADLPMPQGG